MSTRWLPSYWLRKASPRSSSSPISSSAKSPRSRASTKRPPAEIQQRAIDYLAAIEKANDEERKTLGVDDELYEIPGLNAAMLVALGKEGIKTVDDFAGYAADDLVGWTERKDGEVKRFDGTFKDFPVSPRGGRGDDPAGPPQGRLDHRSRSRRRRPTRPRLEEGAPA